MAVDDLTAERVRELFDYDPVTGIMTRKACAATRWRSYEVTRSFDPRGYIKTSVRNRSYFVHRLIWLFVHGQWPVHEIDHINRNPADNRIENLRDVTRKVNIANRKRWGKPKKPPTRTQAPSGSGCVFIDGAARSKPYRARIMIDKRTINLGRFDSAENARAALDAYRQQSTGKLTATA